MCHAPDRGTRPPRRPVHGGGFTLIEVLAALIIVALGMLGVIEAVTQTARNGAYLREKTLAHWIAMNLITERRLQMAAPELAESSDEVEFAGQRWRWNLRVTQTQVESLRRMEVTVRPADAPEGKVLASVTGFYGAAVGGAGGGSLTWSGGPGASGGDGEEPPPEDGGKAPVEPVGGSEPQPEPPGEPQE